MSQSEFLNLCAVYSGWFLGCVIRVISWGWSMACRKQDLSAAEVGIVLPAPRGCPAWPVQLLLTLLQELPGPCVPQQRALEGGLAWTAEELKLFQSRLGKGLSEGSKGLAAWRMRRELPANLPSEKGKGHHCQVYFLFWQTVLYLHRENKDSPQIEELVNRYSR